MRISTFVYRNSLKAGIVFEGGYYLFEDLLKDAPETVLEFIKAYENKPLPDFSDIIKNNSLIPISATEITLCAPIPEPFRDIICLGKNYADHAKELVQTKLATQDDSMIPAAPIYFAKSASPAIGHKGVAPLHSHFTKQVDYEAEIAVIIGKKAKRIRPEQVEDVIFGYTIMNDITARDIQTIYGQWYFGKSLDGFCSLGPHIVTKDEIPYPVKLDISCRVNGETRQKSNTELLIYDIPRIISELSQGMTLFPGDIIATGTPGGVGHAMQPPSYLKPGDEV